MIEFGSCATVLDDSVSFSRHEDSESSHPKMSLSPTLGLSHCRRESLHKTTQQDLGPVLLLPSLLSQNPITWPHLNYKVHCEMPSYVCMGKEKGAGKGHEKQMSLSPVYQIQFHQVLVR